MVKARIVRGEAECILNAAYVCALNSPPLMVPSLAFFENDPACVGKINFQHLPI